MGDTEFLPPLWAQPWTHLTVLGWGVLIPISLGAEELLGTLVSSRAGAAQGPASLLRS